MKNKIRAVVVSLLFTILVGCASELEDYQAVEPRFDLFEYFQGHSTAWGMVQDYTSKQTRRFEVKIEGSVEGNTLTLVEDFVFSDGETSQRIWTIERMGAGLYQGSADDIIGVATGREVGNALQWQYDFELVMDDSTIVVAFDDWLFRQDEKHVFNLTKIKKFGIEVGRITLFFQKL